jgi:hypothetical protein
MDSLRAALDACCDQLREGCGLATSPGRSMQVQSKRATDADWSESFAMLRPGTFWSHGGAFATALITFTDP